MRSEGDPLAVAGSALTGTNALPFAQPYNFRAFCCATLLRAIRALPGMRELRENHALNCRNGGMSSRMGIVLHCPKTVLPASCPKVLPKPMITTV